MKKKAKYNIAVVGVGAVGIEMLRCLRQRNFPINELRVFARSARDIEVDGETYAVKTISPDGFDGVDIALFAGTEGEKGAAVTFAPDAVKKGAIVIDNGADFRLKPDVPLVVPEINPEDVNPVRNWFNSERRNISNGVKKHKGIIANPNCTTIQMVVAIAPIHKKFGIKRLILASYQAASGAGRAAVGQLFNEIKEIAGREQSTENRVQKKLLSQRTLPKQLAMNVFPQIGEFKEDDYTSEEWKTVYETRKILHDDSIKITSTCVRVPVRTGHSEAVYIETKRPAAPKDVRKLLSSSKGIEVLDEPGDSIYPVPLDAEGTDDVFVGRIRRDPFVKNGLWLWVVADNLRKGAALNAVQVAELLIK